MDSQINIKRSMEWKEFETTFSVKLNLEAGKEYQFRYLLDGQKWENDWNADKYVPAPYSNAENSVVITIQ